MSTALLVLAAGMGSRFGGIKQVEAVGPCGEAILEYSIYDGLRAGFDEILFLVRSEIEADFRERILSRLPSSIPCRLVHQEIDSLVGKVNPARTRPWGTGHALLCAAGAIGHPFGVINADDYYGRTSLALVHDFLEPQEPEGLDWCMAGFRLRQTTSPHGAVSRGLCARDPGGQLLSVVEHPRIVEARPPLEAHSGKGAFASLQAEGRPIPLGGEEIVSMNLWGFTPRIFRLALPAFQAFLERDGTSPTKEFYLPALVDSLVAQGSARVEVLETEDAWFGLTYREDLALARERILALVKEGFYPSPLWST